MKKATLIIIALLVAPQVHAMQMGDARACAKPQSTCSQLAACCMGFLMMSQPVHAIYQCAYDLSRGPTEPWRQICGEDDDQQILDYCNPLFVQEPGDHATAEFWARHDHRIDWRTSERDAANGARFWARYHYHHRIDCRASERDAAIEARNVARHSCREWLKEKEE
jgi:hypothetical protein